MIRSIWSKTVDDDSKVLNKCTVWYPINPRESLERGHQVRSVCHYPLLKCPQELSGHSAHTVDTHTLLGHHSLSTWGIDCISRFVILVKSMQNQYIDISEVYDNGYQYIGSCENFNQYAYPEVLNQWFLICQFKLKTGQIRDQIC